MAKGPMHNLTPTRGDDLDVVIDGVFLILGSFDFCRDRFLGLGHAELYGQSYNALARSRRAV